MYLVCNKADYDKFSMSTRTFWDDDVGVYHTVEEALNDSELNTPREHLVFIELGTAFCLKQVTPALVKYVSKKVSK